MIDVYLLLGGFFGADGYLTSAGMFSLKWPLAAIPGVTVKTYPWSSYQSARSDLIKVPVERKTAVIGFSGGASRLTWLADEMRAISARPIDQVIAYDPSPRWQMKPLGPNVLRALTYQNTKAGGDPAKEGDTIATMPSFYGMLGGGFLDRTSDGPKIERFPINGQHALVQFDSRLHRNTVEVIKRLAAG